MKLNPNSDKSIKRSNAELIAKPRTRGWRVERDESGNWVVLPGGSLNYESASSVMTSFTKRHQLNEVKNYLM